MVRNLRQIIVTVVLLVATNAVSYFIGSHEFFMGADVNPDGTESIWYPHYYNTSEALRYERQYANALLEGLHRFYSNDDNDFWFDVFMKTPEYQKIDSINGGDWEDFYHYSTPIMDYDTEQ